MYIVNMSIDLSLVCKYLKCLLIYLSINLLVYRSVCLSINPSVIYQTFQVLPFY